MNLEYAGPVGAEAASIRPATRESFRDGMAKLCSAVTIVTSDGPAGLAGFTATAVSSVTDQPPTLLVCINRNGSAHATVATNGVVAVNTLAAHHVGLSTLFGGRTPLAERFAAAHWLRGETGAPMLADALTSFECRITQTLDVGTHSVLICTVVGILIAAESAGLAYFGRAYHRIGEVIANKA